MNTQEIKHIVQGLIEESKYHTAADYIAEKLNLEFSFEFVRNGKYFDDDKQSRDIYKITLKRKSRKYSFEYGQSIMNSQYYQDKIPGRTYSLCGGARTGNVKILDISKYASGFSVQNPQIKLVKGKEPDLYSVLCCLTKYDPGTFENFCSDFGYDEDSRKAEKTYHAVVDEWKNMQALFTDNELEILSEIQ